jgi:putative Mn2+ efflux pump MntP
MDLALITATAVGLAMDACAVAASSGAHARHQSLRKAMPMVASFGLWQAGMFFVGSLAGVGAVTLLARYGRWIAAAVLVVLGVRMIRASRRSEEDAGLLAFPTGRALVTVSLATSLDAAAAGLSIGLVSRDLVLPALVVGVVTSVLSVLAAWTGQRIGRSLGRVAELCGGALLLAIAVLVARG